MGRFFHSTEARSSGFAWAFWGRQTQLGIGFPRHNRDSRHRRLGVSDDAWCARLQRLISGLDQ
jgi:hypothetical protein